MSRLKKPTLNETIRANEAALKAMCRFNGRPEPEGFDTPEKVKQVRAAPMKSDIPTEHEEQKALVKWFRAEYPKVLIFAVPNAGQRDHNAASWMRAEGLVAGVPDLIVPAWILAIEMKRVKGSSISEEQKYMEGYFKSIGWSHFFAYGCMDAINKTKDLPVGKYIRK